MTRHFWLLVHRYAGLFMAFFLIVIGLTGSIIVFNPELNKWFDPPPSVAVRNTPRLDPYTLRERAQALVPQGLINGLPLNLKPDEPYVAGVEPRVDPATGKPYELDLSVLMLDPYTGAELRREKYSEDILPITSKNVMTLINRLHYQLALPGSVGSYLFGIVALLWTIDCFVSAYLTFPLSVQPRVGDAAAPGTKRKRWLARWWKPAWLVKWSGSAYRINFDLHRAGGLWIWIMLLVLAWSGVGFNLGEQIYTPVMKAVFGLQDPYGELPSLKTPVPEPGLDWRQAHTIGNRLMAEQARIHGFRVEHEESLQYVSDKSAFFYAVRSDRELMDHNSATYLMFDANSGRFAGLNLPTGGTLGNTIHSWIFTLHMAQIWGTPFRIFVTVLGLVIGMLSVTGVYIWLRKRRARSTPKQRRPLPFDGETA